MKSADNRVIILIGELQGPFLVPGTAFYCIV